MYSERHKRHYYYNTRTKESTWKKPKPKQKKKKKKSMAKGSPNLQSNPASASYERNLGERSRQQRNKESSPVWTTHYDPKHRRNYYYNRVTGKSTWSLPPRQEQREGDVRVKDEERKKPSQGGPDVTVKTGVSVVEQMSLDKEEAFRSGAADRAEGNAPKVTAKRALENVNSRRQEPATPVELIPSWRRYFNAKTVDDPSLPQAQTEPQPEPHPEQTFEKSEQSSSVAAMVAPLSERKSVDVNAAAPSRLGVAKVQGALGGAGSAARPKGIGLAFLSEIKSQKVKLQPGIKDNHTETSRASAPSGRMSFLDEIKTKLKARRESLEAMKMKDDLAVLPKSKLREQDGGQDETRSEARSEPNQGAWHRLKTAVMDVRKDREEAKAGLSQASIFQALLSKSREFHNRSDASKEQASSTGSTEAEDWSSEEDMDAEADSPSPSQAEAAWKPQFRVTSTGQFQIQCEGDDWKDFEQDTRLEELDIEEKSISEDSSSALRANRAAIITDLSNTFKQAKTLQRFIMQDQEVC